MATRKKVVIIGGGISGLSAGCYALMNGYHAEIHEAHHLPGGLCTAWKRGDYTIDLCIHWLTGTRPDNAFYRLWEELGIAQNHRLFDFDLFSIAVATDGRRLHWYADPDRLEEELVAMAPEDERASRELCRVIRKLATLPLELGKAPELIGRMGGLRQLLRILPYLESLASMADLTAAQLGARFTNPFLRAAVANFLPDPSLPALAVPMTLGPMGQKASGYPIGGSLPVARTIARRFEELGGRLVLESRVARVVERSGRAVGVRLEGGAEVGADYVIAACDLRHALFSLLDGRRVAPLHRELLDAGTVFSPLALVSFGLSAPSPEPISCAGTSYQLEDPLEVAGRKCDFFGFKGSTHDPTLAPEGKSVVTSGCITSWAYWEPLVGDAEAYAAAKARLADACREQLERRHPGFGAHIEVTDVITPCTFERYTSNWQGTYLTWVLSTEFRRRNAFIPKSVPGLADFFIASMWTNPPGGIDHAAKAGRDVVQLLCHQDRQRFATTIAPSAPPTVFSRTVADPTGSHAKAGAPQPSQ